MTEQTVEQPKSAEQLAAARAEGMRQGKMTATVRVLRALTRNGKMRLDDAMILLEIPRKERKSYRKIFASCTAQKISSAEKKE